MKLTLSPSLQALPSGLSRDAWQECVVAAADSWNRAAAGVAEVEVAVAPPVDWRVAEFDGRNLIVFRRGEWCHNSACGGVDTFPLRAAGMTTSYPPGATGSRVVEGDIELNAALFHSCLGSPENQEASLLAVLVHEIGHVLGMGDRCASHGGITTVNRGSCSVQDQASVMFAAGQSLEPSEPDREMLRQLYPLLQQRPEPKASVALWSLALVVAAMLVLGATWARRRAQY